MSRCRCVDVASTWLSYRSFSTFVPVSASLGISYIHHRQSVIVEPDKHTD